MGHRQEKRKVRKQRLRIAHKHHAKVMLMMMGVPEEVATQIAIAVSSRWPHYKWLAQSTTGMWRMYTDKPVLVDGIWRHEDGSWGRMNLACAPLPNADKNLFDVSLWRKHGTPRRNT